MIKIIDGVKGTGKTKKIIDAANIEVSKGDIVFLSTTDSYRTSIKPQIKFINVLSEGIDCKGKLIGFIKGMLAANYDITTIYIDGIHKMLDKEVDSEEVKMVFGAIESLSNSVNFILTVSCAEDKLPDFIAKYVK